MSLPKANIQWNKLPTSACIEDRGAVYVAHLKGGKQAVVNWSSTDARQAQAFLWAKSRSGADMRCVRAIKAKTHPLPGLGGSRRRRRRKARR